MPCPSVAIPIFEPERRSEVEKIDHGRIRSLPLLELKAKFFSEMPLDPLYFDFSAVSWSAADARRTETYSWDCTCRPPGYSIITFPLSTVKFL